jgi:hypothetical protein
LGVIHYEQTWTPRLAADLNKLGMIYFEWAWGRICFHLDHPGLNEVSKHDASIGSAPRMDHISVMMDIWRVELDSQSHLIFGEAFGNFFILRSLFLFLLFLFRWLFV